MWRIHFEYILNLFTKEKIVKLREWISKIRNYIVIELTPLQKTFLEMKF